MAQRFFTVYIDRATSEHAGAGGTFQIVEVQENDVEIDAPVDQGIHFHDAKEVETYLRTIFPGYEIDVSLEES